MSRLSINILGQLTLVNLTRMGGCLRAPGSFPSHPWRLQAPFSCLQGLSYSLGVPFSKFQVPFFEIYGWILDFVTPNVMNCGLQAVARVTCLWLWCVFWHRFPYNCFFVLLFIRTTKYGNLLENNTLLYLFHDTFFYRFRLLGLSGGIPVTGLAHGNPQLSSLRHGQQGP